jgi:hypothetical protein
MSINPKNRTQPQPVATTAPQVQPVAVPSTIIERPRSEANGYLDPDQTLINFAVREMGYSFERIIREDPNRLLRSWGKVYRKAKATAIGTATMGAGAVLLGVLTGATPLLVAGVLVAGGSGFLVKKHAAGVESCEIEHDVLDDCRPVLAFLAALESRGVNPSDLVSLYDRVIKRVSASPGRFGSASILEKLFREELEQSGVLAQVSGVKTGIGAVAHDNIPADRPSLPESQPIGMSIRLGAVPAASDQPPMPAAQPTLIDVPLGIAKTEYLLSRIFLGGTRSGKSLLVALTIRHLRKRYGSKLRVWVISAAYRPAEAWYWDVADKVSCVDFTKSSPYEIGEAYKAWKPMLEQFTDVPADEHNPKLLILDEASMIGSTSDMVGTEESKAFWLNIRMKINHLSSAGAASGMGIYLIAPVGAVASLNLTRAELGAFFPVFTSDVEEWNEAVYIAAKNNGLAPSNPPTVHTFDAARSVKASSIIGIKGKWLPYQRYDLTPYRRVDKVPAAVAVPVAPPEARAIAPDDGDYESEDPILDLIGDTPDRDKREALMIAYQWASKRLSEGKEVNKDAFLQRARNERRCAHLKDNRDVIWDELSGLIS